ncbi:helicase domain protein [Nitzschia inconspicua]|uniref:Helicase domain protein n=1 Tax=Nitzschia inconspicua TaxID=303405 RepID=A0A9K3M6H0_9STRA|nr:helicase domain protein [Nitzschia inconspicua]
MEPFPSINMDATTGTSNGFCRDLENLVSFLDRAEEVASSASSAFMARKTDYSTFNTILLEPTPIRPDHEIAIRKQHSLTKQHIHQQMFHPEHKTVDQFCASAGSSFSDVFSNMDDEPLDLNENIFSPMVAGTSLRDFIFAPKDNPSVLTVRAGAHSFDEKTWSLSHKTGECSSSSIRFRKYQASQWDDRFQELLLFQQEHGHLLVPHSYPPNQKLSQWVKRQRHQYKRKQMGHHSTLTDEREEKLLAVGFIFDSHRAVWHTRFETLKAFYMANGHCGIPSKFEDGSLNVWIKHQRRQYLLFISGEKSIMTEERIAALNSIGFDWNPRNLHRPNRI